MSGTWNAPTDAVKDRRPIRARENPWVRAAAAWLARQGLRPNQISVLSILFSALSAGCLLLVGGLPRTWAIAAYMASAAFIPLRGLCNLCDGLMAVEGGLKTRAGAIFNDLPDRISDPLLLVAAGYSIGGVGWGRDLGWAAGLLAVLTAYVRVLGGSAGAAQQFCGPMDKSLRMAVIMAACLMAAVELGMGWTPRAMVVGLCVVIAGCVITVIRRTRRILKELESR
ncbi:MAG TPA: CDP-alcohol phosphatidyltransferase family protein [Candidatus Methylomirabilis sp.]|nr:CDP-alcohol phosphatidyltransferase family protein [Candidatus Methylomirabilis sp.]